MVNVTIFRGTAGEVAVSLLSPWVFFTATPIAVLFFIIGLIAGLMGFANSQWLGMFFGLLATGFIVGRISLSAARGNPAAGIFDNSVSHGEALQYAIRYAVLISIVGLIVACLMWLLTKNIGASLFGMMNLMAVAAMGFRGVAMIVVMFLSMLAVIASFIIAIRVDRVTDLFSMEAWTWLIQERPGDFFAFLAVLSGGMTLFYFVYSIPIVVVIAVAFAMHAGLGTFMVAFIYLLMLAVAVVHLGRLCGMFVTYDWAISAEPSGSAGDPAPHLATVSSAASKQVHAATAKVTTNPIGDPVSPLTPGFSFDDVVAKVRATAADQLETEVNRLKETIKTNPADIGASVELTLTYKKMNKDKEMREEAAQSLGLLIAMEDMDSSEKLFHGLGKDRMHTPLVPEDKIALGQYLMTNGQFLEGGVLLYAGMKVNDAVLAEKKVIEVARAAANAGKSKEALILYQQLLKWDPNSNFADFIKDAILSLQSGQ
ncbi:MAG: hypothetical protein OEY67_07840 [Gammaproteobacteria bacterium]|nr:hypothetical protein [Gammaproteobacteria bacterium]